MGIGVVIRNCSSDGVIASRFSAREKKSKTCSIGIASRVLSK